MGARVPIIAMFKAMFYVRSLLRHTASFSTCIMFDCYMNRCYADSDKLFINNLLAMLLALFHVIIIESLNSYYVLYSCIQLT